MTALIKTLQKLTLTTEMQTIPRFLAPARNKKWVDKPEIGRGKSFRRIVHFPAEYTVRPLEVTNLGGRDPASGRLVVKGIGGGVKRKYHWVQWRRHGPDEEGKFVVERVIKIMKDWCRTSFVAMVARDDELRYILAPQGLKEGDLIRTSSYIPRIPVRANIGDSFPLGALPVGTQVHCVEKYPGLGGFLVHAAGACATVARRAPDGRVVVQLPSRREFALPERCMCTVGRLGNADHAREHVGSAQRNRELGNRPRSGWRQRKTGRFGRKLRKPPPTRTVVPEGAKAEVVKLSLPGLP